VRACRRSIDANNPERIYFKTLSRCPHCFCILTICQRRVLIFFLFLFYFCQMPVIALKGQRSQPRSPIRARVAPLPFHFPLPFLIARPILSATGDGEGLEGGGGHPLVYSALERSITPARRYRAHQWLSRLYFLPCRARALSELRGGSNPAGSRAVLGGVRRTENE
jgi:hypothetical protein